MTRSINLYRESQRNKNQNEGWKNTLSFLFLVLLKSLLLPETLSLGKNLVLISQLQSWLDNKLEIKIHF